MRLRLHRYVIAKWPEVKIYKRVEFRLIALYAKGQTFEALIDPRNDKTAEYKRISVILAYFLKL